METTSTAKTPQDQITSSFGALGDMLQDDNEQVVLLLKELNSQMVEQGKFDEDTSIELQEIYDLLDRRLPADGMSQQKETLDREGDIKDTSVSDRLDKMISLMETMNANISNMDSGGGGGGGLLDGLLDLAGDGKSPRTRSGPRPRTLLGRLGGAARTAGTVFKNVGGSKLLKYGAAPLTGVLEGYSEYQTSGDVSRSLAAGTGAGLGMWGGAAAGAAAGSFIPIVGTGIGAIIGGLLGAYAGGGAGRWINDAAETAFTNTGTEAPIGNPMGDYDPSASPYGLDPSTPAPITPVIPMAPTGNPMGDYDPYAADNTRATGTKGETGEEVERKDKVVKIHAGERVLNPVEAASYNVEEKTELSSIIGNTSESKKRYIAGELYSPNAKMTDNQLNAIEAGIAKGVVYPADILRDFFAQSGAEKLSSENVLSGAGSSSKSAGMQSSMDYGTPTPISNPMGDFDPSVSSSTSGSYSSDTSSTSNNSGASPTEGATPGKAGKFRPVYEGIEDDLRNDDLINIIGNEARKNNASIDAVINNMMNRLGSKSYGNAKSLTAVAKQSGQYESWDFLKSGRFKPVSKEHAEMIRSRLRLIASGAMPDTTGGANEFRARSYLEGKGRGKTFDRTARSQGFNDIGGNVYADTGYTKGAYAAYPTPNSEFSHAERLDGAPSKIPSMSKETALNSVTPTNNRTSETTTSKPGAPSSSPMGSSMPDPANPLPAVEDMVSMVFKRSAMFAPI